MRAFVTLRLVIPAIWFGMVVALSFLEAPLKFTAPGITIPLGLGIGRIVFFALAIAGWILLVALTAVSVPRPGVGRRAWWLLGGMWVVMALQTFAIRPPLNARSDVTIAGGVPDPASGWLHYAYIGTDVLLLALLVVWVVLVARRLPVVAPAPAPAPRA